MALLTFKKGVHPHDHKELSKESPIQRFPAPKTVYIPVCQHLGSPSQPVVAKGDRVKKGTLIAKVTGFVSANVHSSVSGTVKDIVDIPTVFGNRAPAVVIENDGLDEKDYLSPLNSEDRAVLIERIKECGLVGMGGATFPTQVKLSPPPDKKIDILIINGAECEPYLTSDYRLMLESPESVIEGARIFLKILGAQKGYIGIEANKQDVYEKMDAILKDNSVLKAVLLKTKYPQGAEKQLIYAVTKRKVPAGGLPMDVGVVVQNSATAVAAYEAVKAGKPLFERIVTVSGSGINKPANLLVSTGTLVKDVIEHCGGLTEEAAKVILGGPMMGISVAELDIPVTKGTSGIVVLTDKEVQKEEYEACIRCGKCVDACPMNLSPFHYIALGEVKQYIECEKWRVMDCMECGSCAYVCPAKRPIVQFVKIAKQKVLAEIRRRGAK